MIFAGSVSGAFAFSITGAPVVGSEVKIVELSSGDDVSHGTGPGEANAGAALLETIPAASVLSIDLENVDASSLGFTGVVRFTEIRALWIRNTETSAAKVVLLGCPSGGNDTTAYAAKLPGGGRFAWDDFTTGIPVTSANRYLTLTNVGTGSAVVQVGLIGLGTLIDAGA
jgi:hypothetical protein